MFATDPTQALQAAGGYGQTDLLSQIMKSAMSGGAGPSVNFNFNFGADGTRFSEGAFDRGGPSSMPSFGGNQPSPLGFNSGQGMVPGFGGFAGPGAAGGQQQQQQQMMQMMMMMLMMMMQIMQRQGLGQPQQQPAGQQQPGGQQPIGQQQPVGQQQPAGQQQGPGGGTFDLQKGQSFTTPGGSTIEWKGNTVKVKEPGGQQRDLDAGGGSASAAASSGKDGSSAAAAASGRGSSAAAAASGDGSSAAAAASGSKGDKSKDTKGREWKVWGDPHIQNPDGSKQDFKTKNAMFTLQDGTKLLMTADKPDGNVNKVRVTLPGGQMNLQGIDQKQTTVYGNGDGKFENRGTLDQYQNAFPNAGLNNSPSGNQLWR